MEDEKIIALLEGYVAGSLSEEDAAAFFQWYSHAGLEEFHRVFSQCNLSPGSLPGAADMPENFRIRLEEAIQAHEANEQQDDGEHARAIPLFRRYRLGWAAAILLMLSTGGYLLYHRTPSGTGDTANHHPSSDVAPGTTRAVLTLADGKQVTIDSARTGQLAIQGKMSVQNNHGAITYDSNAQTAIQKNVKAPLYNTLATNRGEQSPPLTLSDGTKVWLNALSSIRFPVAFTGDSRDVEITGEAFFEVAKNAALPFHVRTTQMDVEVLGTQFNINAYSDEPDIRTTLLEGSVKIGSLILEPGQQARMHTTVSLVKDPDITQAMAWKKGLFDFNHADLQTVLRQLARWYDIDVKFEGNISPRTFHGKITRDLNLSQVIQLLQDVGIKFRIEGKILVVTP